LAFIPSTEMRVCRRNSAAWRYRRRCELRPVRLAQEPLADLLGVHAGLRREHAHGELLLGHFQREDGHGNPFLDGAELGDVEGKGRFPHAGAAGDDDEIRSLEPRGHLVELRESRGDARDELLPLVEALDRAEAVLDDVLEGVKGGPDLVLGDFEDGVLGLVEHAVHSAAP
jgi:hypothetical protein